MDARRGISEEMTVYTQDGEKLGKVVAVDDAGLFVEKGFFFPREYGFRLDDVAEVRQQMAEHLVRPVEFAAEIEAMHADGARVFLEVGPKSVLSRLASKILDGRPHVAIALDDGTGLGGLLNGLAQLACAEFARRY